MKIIDAPQRSPEWFAARQGVPTASRFDQILTPAKGEPSKSQDGLINELLAESLGLMQVEDRKTAAMENGNALEDEARAFYELEHANGAKVIQVGLVMADCGRFGASPDALVGEDGILELKAPTAPIHVGYVRAGVLPSDYKLQCHGLLVVTGRKWLDFLSYHRGLPALCVRVARDEFTAKLAAELERFSDKYQEARARFGLPPLGGTK